MDDAQTFAKRICTRYPEGLTGLFAVGGTRTTYILERNRRSDNPGKIADYADYSAFMLQRYFDFVRMFLSLGGQNLDRHDVQLSELLRAWRRLLHFVALAP